MRVYTNVVALNAQRNMQTTERDHTRALERLSSGLRINRASDDAAGLAISEKLRSQITGLKQATRNAQDGISMIQTAEGALDEVHSIVQRMRELAVQAANGTLSDTERSLITNEFSALQTEITRIGNVTKFGGTILLNGGLGSTATGSAAACLANGVSGIASTGGSAGAYSVNVSGGTNTGVKFTVLDSTGATVAVVDDVATVSGLSTKTLSLGSTGINLTINSNMTSASAMFTVTLSAGSAFLLIGSDATSDDMMPLSISDMRATALGVDSGTVTVDTAANAQSALSALDTAIGAVSNQRAKLGALQNRLEHTINSLGVAVENLSSSESRIRDADFAVEVAAMTRGQILQQAGTAVAAQANQLPQAVLQLLRQ